MVESPQQGETLVKLILRNKEYEVKPGMNLLAALQKINIIPESVIATRDGEMILDDEILKDGDVVKLVAVISGGSILDTRDSGFDGELSNIEYRLSNNEYRP
jgi:sulfur carrier protein ThiS